MNLSPLFALPERWRETVRTLQSHGATAQADALLLAIDLEHNALDGVALLDQLVGVGDLLGPRHVADV